MLELHSEISNAQTKAVLDNSNIVLDLSDSLEKDFFKPSAEFDEPENLKKFKEKTPFFIIITILYGLFYTFCMYKNPCGITAPLYVLGTLGYFYIGTKQIVANFELKNYKRLFLYAAVVFALGINLCVTTDTVLVVLDHIGIILVTAVALLSVYYSENKWGIGKYFSSIINVVFGGAGRGFSLFGDFKDYLSSKMTKEENSYTRYIVAGIFLSTPLLIVVIVLLSSADKFFADLVANILIAVFEFKLFTHMDLFLSVAISALVVYGALRGLCNKCIKESVEENKGNAIIACTVNCIVGFVYVIFSGYQIIYLFMGNMTIPEGYSYAEYARQGFFQLVCVCLINMVIVLAGIYKFEYNKALKASLLLISACTYIMIASSTIRMMMYVSAYQLTYTRLFVFLALIVIFLEMNGIVITIIKPEFPLFKYSMVMVTACYLIFAYSRPCGIIARNNLDSRFCEDADGRIDYSRIDFNYINTHLGSDAAPEVMAAALRENNTEFDEAIERFFEYSDCDYTVRTWNYSLWRLKSLVNYENTK